MEKVLAASIGTAILVVMLLIGFVMLCRWLGRKCRKDIVIPMRDDDKRLGVAEVTQYYVLWRSKNGLHLWSGPHLTHKEAATWRDQVSECTDGSRLVITQVQASLIDWFGE
jgi:hypothetical protein